MSKTTPAFPEAGPALLDSLLRGLRLISQDLGEPLSPAATRAAGPVPVQLGAVAGFQCVAEKLGYHVAVLAANNPALEGVPAPFLVVQEPGRAPLLITKRHGSSLVGQDLSSGESRLFGQAELRQTARQLLLARRAEDDEEHRRDWRGLVADCLRGVVLELGGASLFINLFALATPVAMMAIYNKVLGQAALTTLDVLALGLVLVYLFDAGLRLIRGYVASHTGARLEAMLGGEAVRHLLRLPYRQFETGNSGLIAERIRQLDVIRNFFTGQMPLTLVDLLFVPLILTVLLVIAPPLAWITLAAMPLLAGLPLVLHAPQRRRQEQQFNCQAARTSTLNEILHNAPTIKSLGVEGELEQRWSHQLGLSAWAGFKAARLSGVLDVLSMSIQSLATLAIVYAGATLIIAGELSFGALIAANLLASRALAPMRQLVSAWHQVQAARTAFERIGMLLAETPEAQSASRFMAPTLQGDIRFEQVTYRYAQEAAPVLDRIDLHIQRGEFIGIIGPSGCGKSTLAKLIQGLYRPEGGRVLIDGNDGLHLPPSMLRREIGVVPQEVQLFAGTVRDNIALGAADKTTERVMAVARFVGAHDFIQRLPGGYDTRLGERGQGLSAGQRQLLAVARALMRNPRILIMDEATSALDPQTEERLMQRLVQAHQGRTLVMISHRMAPLRLADRVALVRNGRVERLGPPETIIGMPRPAEGDADSTADGQDMQEVA